MNEKGQGNALGALVLLIVLVAALWACGTQLSSCSQQINQAIQSYSAEQSAAAARATDTAVQIIVAEATRHAEATATFVAPTVEYIASQSKFNDQKARTDFETRQNNQRIWNLFLLGLTLSLFAGTFVGIMYLDRRSKRTLTPNGPVYNEGGVIVPAGKMIGAIKITRPDMMDYLRRWLKWVFKREYTPPPAAAVEQLDGGATAQMYAAQARADTYANALVGAMSSKLTEEERLKRMEMLQGPRRSRSQSALKIMSPTPEIVAGYGGELVRYIAAQCGLQPPAPWQVEGSESEPTHGETQVFS